MRFKRHWVSLPNSAFECTAKTIGTPNMYSEKILTPEQLQAIGSVAVEASRLEEWVEILIWELCGFDEKTGRVFTERMMLDAKVELFRDLFTQRNSDKKIASEFKEIFDKIKGDIPKRNTIIHGHWSPEDIKASLFKIVSGQSCSDSVAVRKRLKKTPPPVLAKDVIEVARRLHYHRKALVLFFGKHEALFPLASKSV